MNAPTAGPRVVVVCDYSLGYLGGAQTALLQEAAALAAAGAQVLLLSPTSEQVWARVRPPESIQPPPQPPRGHSVSHFGGVLRHVRVPSRFTLPGLDLPVVRNNRRSQARLAELLIGHRCEVVQLHSEFGLAAAATTVAAQLGMPVVHTVHTFFWQAPVWQSNSTSAAIGQRLLAAGVRRFHHLITQLPPTNEMLADRPADSALRNMTLTIARLADLVLSPSEHQAVRLRQAGLEHVAVLPNTVATMPESTALTAVDGPLKIIWTGRCVPEKRILTFVRAAVAALDTVGADKINFTVVGDGPQLPQARSIAGSRPGISFLGRQNHDRVAELLAESHCAALTSYGFDNQPMTVVEAVMALRGVIYCDPALREGLDGPGILAPQDENGLAAKLIELAEDPEPVVAASHTAVEVRAGFSPEQHAEKLITHYRQLIMQGS